VVLAISGQQETLCIEQIIIKIFFANLKLEIDLYFILSHLEFNGPKHKKLRGFLSRSCPAKKND
jgi:hypothetical protein